MVMSTDHPDLQFIQAKKVTGVPACTPGRKGKTVLWLIVHDQEAPETEDNADVAAAYFARGADGRSVSAHYVVDKNKAIQCVALEDSAWTVGNAQGNDQGVNYELAGYARQTRAQWLDAYSMSMFRVVAPIMRADAARFGIPLRQLTDAQVRAYAPGVSSHAQIARVFGGSDHTDPGPNFPWDIFMSLLTEGIDDMAIDDRVLLAPGSTDKDDVIEYQIELEANGYELPRFGHDGGYGTETTAATKLAQADAAAMYPDDNFLQTGSLDVKLWNWLKDGGKTPSVPPVDCSTCETELATVTAERDTLAGQVAAGRTALGCAPSSETV